MFPLKIKRIPTCYSQELVYLSRNLVESYNRKYEFNGAFNMFDSILLIFIIVPLQPDFRSWATICDRGGALWEPRNPVQFLCHFFLCVRSRRLHLSFLIFQFLNSFSRGLKAMSFDGARFITDCCLLLEPFMPCRPLRVGPDLTRWKGILWWTCHVFELHNI